MPDNNKRLQALIAVAIVAVVVAASMIVFSRTEGEELKAAFSIFPENPVATETVYFNTSGSKGQIITWVWDFGDGNIAYGQNVSHAYRYPGNFTVSLEIGSYSGKTDAVAQEIFVETKNVTLSKTGNNLVWLPRYPTADTLDFAVESGNERIIGCWSGEVTYGTEVSLFIHSAESGWIETTRIFVLDTSFEYVAEHENVSPCNSSFIGIQAMTGMVRSYRMEISTEY